MNKESRPERSHLEGDERLLKAVEGLWQAFRRGESPDVETWPSLPGVTDDERRCLDLVEALHDAAGILAEDTDIANHATSANPELPATQSHHPEPRDSIPSGSIESKLKPGAALGHYQIRQVLGRGGQAVTCKAWDQILQRHVVLKLYHRCQSDADREVILSEGRKLARVRSKHVPECYAVEETHGYPYLVMEFIPGKNLAEVYASRSVTTEESLRLISRVADGLREVHARGLLHCDIKPGNILISNNGTPYLVDFGLAKRFGDSALAKPSGTPAYMSPEQACGDIDRIDQRTDVFGLGATLYFLLTGLAPFRGHRKEDVWRSARECQMTPSAQLNNDSPTRVHRLCMKCLEKAPDDRFETATELMQAIDQQSVWRRVAIIASIACVAVILMAFASTIVAVRTGWAGRNGEHQTPNPQLKNLNLYVQRSDETQFNPLVEDHFATRTPFVISGRDSFRLSGSLEHPSHSYWIWFDTRGLVEVVANSSRSIKNVAFPSSAEPTSSAVQYTLVNRADPAGLQLLLLVTSVRCDDEMEAAIEARITGLGKPPQLVGVPPLRSDSPIPTDRGAGETTMGKTLESFRAQLRSRLPEGVDPVYEFYFRWEPPKSDAS